MFRYFAVAWGSEDPSQSETAQRIRRRLKNSSPRWQRSYVCNGLWVYCNDISASLAPRALTGSTGIVLGTVFARTNEPGDVATSVIAFSTAASKKIIGTQGQSLVDDYWGNYVAFLRDAAGEGTWVLKDPTGLLPCLRVEHRGVQCFFSSASDYLGLGITRFSINWDCIAKSVATAHLAGAGKPLNELDELLRGEGIRIDLRSNRLTRRALYWKPTKFMEHPHLIEEPVQAAAELRTTVRHCVRSWGSLHKSLIHRLSGGLDSSIVLGALVRPACPGNEAIACATYHGDDAPSDERRWAGMVAEFAGRPLHTYRFDIQNTSLEPMLEAQPVPSPTYLLSHYLRSRIEQTLTEQTCATAITTGEGGDSVFGSLSITAAMDEFLHQHGLRRGALKLAAQIGAYRDTTAGRVLWGAMRRHWFGTQFHDRPRGYDQFSFLLTPTLKALLQRQTHLEHPYIEDRKGAPWGFINRLGSLLVPSEFYDAFVPAHAFRSEWIHPLLSQPVMERCLSIPLYTHFLDGRDRGLARSAFANEVPKPVLRRQWKGRGSIAAAQLVFYNIRFLRTLLLDGSLVRERFLSRAQLEHALSEAPTSSPANTTPILLYMHFELWLQQWLKASRWERSGRSFSNVI